MPASQPGTTENADWNLCKDKDIMQFPMVRHPAEVGWTPVPLLKGALDALPAAVQPTLDLRSSPRRSKSSRTPRP